MKISKSEEFHFGDSSCVVLEMKVILLSMQMSHLAYKKDFSEFSEYCIALVSDFAWLATHPAWYYLLRIAHKKFPNFKRKISTSYQIWRSIL